MSVTDHAADLERTLHDRFGLTEFRTGQREVIENVLRGRDVLCVMPTGGGKSLCYQLPALILPGLTLVISPLIALMKDQVDALRRRGIRATLLNSTLDPSEQRVRILEIEAGQYDLVYVAPERFRSGRFVEAMGKARPALLAVDEAHCISEWGHDFRPDYARIGLARRRLGSPPCIALTATATDLVRRDIAEQLGLNDPALFVTGFDRPNLFYAAAPARREADKLAAVSRALADEPGPAIIYASSRARCESVAEFVRHDLRRPAVVYHAGLSREERADAQERFMRGGAGVVVATNAFGMGVDKADIRSVIHYNMPGTLEAYYQEAGRAGRDGLPARCLLLHAQGDRMLQERFIDNEYPPPAAVLRVYQYLCTLDADPIELTQAEVREAAGVDLGESAVGTALKLLEAAGAVERFQPRENMAIVRINAEGDPTAPEPASLADRLNPQAHVQRIVLLGLEGLVNRRYSEPVYFHPDELAANLGLDRTALIRALKALTAELPIDYVPPFRGNATRVLDRGRKAKDLGVDFGALLDRKRRELDKLDLMVKFAQGTGCRRGFLLNYFGDDRASDLHCGRCDNCDPAGGAGGAGGGAATPAAIDTPAGHEVVLKVLSGVARTKGRFGKTMVAQMLNGSASEKLGRVGLKSLTTFGILPDFTQPELSKILDALTAAGYVEAPEVDRFRPVVNLTEAGWELLRTQPGEPLALTLPEDLTAKVRNGGLERVAPRPRPELAAIVDASVGEAEAEAGGDPLFERLRALRQEWAREAKQPAYCVFNDQTLEELVRVRPQTPQALAAVKGVGPARLERFGSALLAAIAGDPGHARSEPDAPTVNHDDHGISKNPKPLPVAPRAASGYVPTEEWTWRLLDRGFTAEEAAAIRGLDRAAILRHATLAARQGRPVAPGAFLEAEAADRWNAWRAEHGDAAPPDGSVDPDLWSLFVACRRGG